MGLSFTGSTARGGNSAIAFPTEPTRAAAFSASFKRSSKFFTRLPRFTTNIETTTKHRLNRSSIRYPLDTPRPSSSPIDPRSLLPIPLL